MYRIIALAFSTTFAPIKFSSVACTPLYRINETVSTASEDSDTSLKNTTGPSLFQKIRTVVHLKRAAIAGLGKKFTYKKVHTN